MTLKRDNSQKTKCWVIKLGSSLLTNNGCGLKTDTLSVWVSQIMSIMEQGINVVLVSSGAVAEGVSRLDMDKRPHELHKLQAVAAVGQMGLIQAYEYCFQKYGIHTAQILLTHDDISNRRRYLNARSTLRTLIDLGAIPIVNENDSVATEEIRFGDNDTLAGLVANLVEADLLVILTDQKGLFEKDPRKYKNPEFIKKGIAGDSKLEKHAGDDSVLGRGGMLTKLRAAATAAKSGSSTIIASGVEENVLVRIAAGDEVGTLLESSIAPMTARKQWLAGQSIISGKLKLDNGAVTAIRTKGKSLLAVGVTTVEGQFRRGEVVRCVNEDSHEVARGLVNYSSEEIQLILGETSSKTEQILGYINEPELIHRDNMVVD